MIGDTTDRLLSTVPAAVGESKDGTFLKWAGWSGLVATIAFLVTVLMTFSAVSGPEGPADMTRFLDDVAEAGTLEYVYGVAGIVLAVLYIPMAIGTYLLLRRTVAAWFGSVAVAFGLAVLLPAYVINLLAPFGLVPLAAELGGAGSEALYANYEVARVMAELFFTVGSLLTLGFGPLLWGVAWLRSELASRWVGWAAVATGVTGMVWFVWLIDNAAAGYVLIVNVLVSLVLFAGVSVILVRQGRAAPSAG